jgi:hypothetical protein
LGDGFTAKQKGLFEYVAKIVMALRGATIDTLIELLSDDDAIDRYLPRLMDQPDLLDFIRTEWRASDIAGTKVEIRRRLRNLRGKAGLGDMLTSPVTNLDMGSLLDQRKLVIVRIDKNRLGEATSVVARFAIAMTVSAIRARRITKGSPYWFGWIDEVRDFTGGATDDHALMEWLTQGREQLAGCGFCHQELEQLTGRLKDSLLGNAGIRFAANVQKKDAGAMAGSMGTSIAFLQSLQTENGHGEFGVWINGVMRNAAVARVRFGTFESRPRLSDARLGELMAMQRAFWAKAGGADAQQKERTTSVRSTMRRRAVSISITSVSTSSSLRAIGRIDASVYYAGGRGIAASPG